MIEEKKEARGKEMIGIYKVWFENSFVGEIDRGSHPAPENRFHCPFRFHLG